MNGRLKIGTIVTSKNGNRYCVRQMLGSGGQGEVYEVVKDQQHYALKWYFKRTATLEQKNILENLIAKGSPSPIFLWPKDLVFLENAIEFGYIMELRPSNFHSIVDLMKCRVEPSFFVLCKAAYNLTKGYQKLHGMGYCYRDISFGNVFFDADTGAVLIGDNDNVTPNGMNDGNVLGTPRFMAPEIVLGKGKPSRNTDAFSLAVLLFYMFIVNHPLEGKLESSIKCMDIHAMNRLYGEHPVFIFDPQDESNRPVPEYHGNALAYWPIYPEKLKELFRQSFTVGLQSPNRRVTENQWLDVLANLMTGIIECQNCGAENFYDECKQEGVLCWNCSQKLQIPGKLVLEKNKVLITPTTQLYSHHLYHDYDMDTLVAKVVQNPKNPNLWGFKNQTKESWTYEKADGTQMSVPHGKSAAIAQGAKIYFGTTVGKFEA